MGTIVQYFNTTAQAQSGIERLRAMGIPDTAIGVYTQVSAETTDAETGSADGARHSGENRSAQNGREFSQCSRKCER